MSDNARELLQAYLTLTVSVVMAAGLYGAFSILAN